jgi:hypothetical protein
MWSCPSQQCQSERTPEARTRRVGGESRELGYPDSPPPVSWGKHTGTARKPAAGREAGSRENSHTVPRVARPDTTLAHLLDGRRRSASKFPLVPSRYFFFLLERNLVSWLRWAMEERARLGGCGKRFQDDEWQERAPGTRSGMKTGGTSRPRAPRPCARWRLSSLSPTT